MFPRLRLLALASQQTAVLEVFDKVRDRRMKRDTLYRDQRTGVVVEVVVKQNLIAILEDSLKRSDSIPRRSILIHLELVRRVHHGVRILPTRR